jgi:hypothetical protein
MPAASAPKICCAAPAAIGELPPSPRPSSRTRERERQHDRDDVRREHGNPHRRGQPQTRAQEATGVGRWLTERRRPGRGAQPPRGDPRPPPRRAVADRASGRRALRARQRPPAPPPWTPACAPLLRTTVVIASTSGSWLHVDRSGGADTHGLHLRGASLASCRSGESLARRGRTRTTNASHAQPRLSGACGSSDKRRDPGASSRAGSRPTAQQQLATGAAACTPSSSKPHRSSQPRTRDTPSSPILRSRPFSASTRACQKTDADWHLAARPVQRRVSGDRWVSDTT